MHIYWHINDDELYISHALIKQEAVNLIKGRCDNFSCVSLIITYIHLQTVFLLYDVVDKSRWRILKYGVIRM